jgi:hypothetical protein
MNFTKAIADGLARAQQRVEEALASNLDAAVDEAEQLMKSRVPVVTGELRDSIGRDDSGRVRRIRVSAPYAAVIEFGRPGTSPQPFWRPGVALMRRRTRARQVVR